MTQQTEMVVESLEKLLEDNALSENDATFAESLVNGKYGYRRRGYLTDKQLYAAQKMVRKVQQIADQPKEQVGDLTGLYLLMHAAKGNLKYPKLNLLLPDEEKTPIKLNIAGERSCRPGLINIVTADRVWLGRVDEQGNWDHRDDGHDYATVGKFLKRLSQDPATVAAEYGHVTGCCTFCSRPLTDNKSLTVGYGPVCAKNYGLPWGAK